MKSLIVGLMLVVSSTAMAQEDIVSHRESDYQVDVLSWCEENYVMGQNSKGEVEVRYNCSEQGLKCTAGSMYRMNRTIHFASCQPQ
ncbi:hypothetical protein [Bdellovibrio bacteriovorus]|uniref:Uncharacterized protein n=1 Tax=Bdellovibrio bacteriovorus TaxID=959 RepID=A0A150WTN7_BDEBC|nr:hypothetical protein [Bdellovibrio bacteriovorus]KYG67654.1 hypothetical protein AZI85_16785 [Bdellovibrio bacteriovorus]